MTNIDAGLGFLHAATGLFFMVTGYRKMFTSTGEKFTNFLTSLHIPKPAIYAVMAGEFFGGLGLFVGFLTQIAAFGLLIIMIGAYKMDTWPTVKARKPDCLSAWVSHCLCTPEGQLIICLITLILTGAGEYSLDALIF